MRALFACVAVYLCWATLQAQKSIGPPPTTTTKGPPPCVAITADDLIGCLRGNEQSPTIISGVTSLFHVLAPTSDVFNPDQKHGGLNWEHVMRLHSMGNPFGKPSGCWFTPRTGTMTIAKLDARAMQLTRPAVDPCFPGLSAVLTYTFEGSAITLTAAFHVANATPFEPEDSFGVFFASYMGLTQEVALHARGIASAGAPETWLTLNGGSGSGGTYMHADASQLVYNSTGDGGELNIAAFDYPRYTQPFYAVRLQSGLTYCAMFDTAFTASKEVRFSLFKFFVKDPNNPTNFYPAADWQVWFHNVQVGDYGFTMRTDLIASYDVNACLASYQAWGGQ